MKAVMQALLALLVSVSPCLSANLNAVSARSFAEPRLPKALLEAAAEVNIRTHIDRLNFKDPVCRSFELLRIQAPNRLPCGLEVFYREAIPPPGSEELGDVLLLHGVADSSLTWARPLPAHRHPLQPSTMQLLAATGYRVVALDLPPPTPDSPVQTQGVWLNPPEDLLRKLIKILNLRKPAIVAPGTAGHFVAPLLQKHREEMGALVSIAMCCASPLHDWQTNLTPTLMIHGQWDGVPSGNLRRMPYKNLLIVPRGGHETHLSNPPLFHAALLNFLLYLDDIALIPDPEQEQSEGLNGFHRRNFTARHLNPRLLVAASKEVVEARSLVMEKLGGGHLLARFALPRLSSSIGNVLLLHGPLQSSAIWAIQGTLQLLAAAGYSATAIDLPSLGPDSSNPCVEDTQLRCIITIIQALGLHKPLIVAPGLSASLALDVAASAEEFGAGALLISPQLPPNSSFPFHSLRRSRLPMLALSGPSSSSEVLSTLGEMSNAQVFRLPSEEDEPHIFQRRLFHRLLLNFADAVLASPPLRP